MKKQLSFVLLTISVFSLNTLPARTAITENLESAQSQNEFPVIGYGQWCVQLPWMGLFCWDL